MSTRYEGLKVAELSNELRKRGLITSGRKSELIERLQKSDRGEFVKHANFKYRPKVDVTKADKDKADKAKKDKIKKSQNLRKRCEIIKKNGHEIFAKVPMDIQRLILNYFPPGNNSLFYGSPAMLITSNDTYSNYLRFKIHYMSLGYHRMWDILWGFENTISEDRMNELLSLACKWFIVKKKMNTQHCGCCHEFLANMINVNTYIDPTTGGYVGTLCSAICINDLQVFKMLVAGGANINIIYNNDGTTPLILAAKYKSLDMFNFLLKRSEENPNINHRDHQGKTALTHAIEAGCPDMVYALLDMGAQR